MVAIRIPVSELTISTDKTLLDADWVIPALKSMPWGVGVADNCIREALASEKSLCFGMYRIIDLGDDEVDLEMIGFARVVGDGVVFSSIMDLIIEEQYRKQGLGTKLMQDIIEHPKVKGTYCILGTDLAVLPTSAVQFFKKFGYKPCDGVMKREP